MTAGWRFLTRSLKGTRTEMDLSILAYNMLRTINIKAATTLNTKGGVALTDFEAR